MEIIQVTVRFECKVTDKQPTNEVEKNLTEYLKLGGLKPVSLEIRRHRRGESRTFESFRYAA